MKYEFKYIVHNSHLDQLRDMILPYVELDPYAADTPGKEYIVRSIYFDTQDFDYYFEKIDGYKIRKKIRIRGYNKCVGNDAVFMEIKRKLKEPIEKDRTRMTFEIMRRLMNGEGAASYGPGKDDHGINGAGKFLFHVYRNNLKPVVLVIYEREAFFEKFDGRVRMTLDKNLRCIAYPGLDDLYSDKNTIPALKDHFIFEVKFFDHFPGWLRPITGKLGLLRTAASKYVISIDAQKLTDTSYKSDMFKMMHWRGL
jgi:hypothetical protein